MIICFSGTGNTALAARLMAKRLGEEKIMTIGRDYLSSVDLSNEKRVVWMFPIYSWGVPPVVKRLIRSIDMPGADTIPHFMVATCGDDAGLAHEMWRKCIQRRGWKAMAAHTVQMPNTYVLLPGFDVDSDRVRDEKLAALADSIDRVGHAIKCGSPISNVVRGRMPWVKTRLIYPLFMRFLSSPRPFHATDQCTSCGMCERQCPLHNINLHKGCPTWGNNCAMCLRCYHHCPARAIQYGSRTRSKGHYTPPTSLD